MPEHFPYDVFLSHSSKGKAVVRPLAERLRLTFSQLSTLNHQPACDPLNKERRFIPLRLADTHQTCFETCGRRRIHRQSRI